MFNDILSLPLSALNYPIRLVRPGEGADKIGSPQFDMCGALIIDPAPAGGAYIVGMTNTAMCVSYVPPGPELILPTDQPFRLTVDDSIIRAVATHLKDPRGLGLHAGNTNSLHVGVWENEEGDFDSVAAAHIDWCSQPAGADLRMWQGLITAACEGVSPGLHPNTHIDARGLAVFRLSPRDAFGVRFFQRDHPTAPVILCSTDNVGFFGMYMPFKCLSDDKKVIEAPHTPLLPAWMHQLHPELIPTITPEWATWMNANVEPATNVARHSIVTLAERIKESNPTASPAQLADAAVKLYDNLLYRELTKL